MLALDKPAGLLTSPHRDDPQKPSLMKLLHTGLAQDKPWAKERGLSYLMNTHRLDFETSGILLLAKTKQALVAMANLFGTEKPVKGYTALVHGSPGEARFTVNARLAPHAVRIGQMRVDKIGKRSRTEIEVRERFSNITLVTCQPLIERAHQIRLHLKHAGYPIIGDTLYGGSPLLLSQLKGQYRLKPGRSEKPLIERVALHAEELAFVHPVSGARIGIRAPWPKDLSVAVKYLRRYAAKS